MPSFTEWKDAYVAGLDATLVAASQVSEFNAANVEYLGGRNVKFRKLTFGSGTAAYSRFASADDDFEYSYETKTLANDREKEFYLDWSDANDFPVDDASEVMGEFLRIKVAPEQDANFIAKVAAAAANTDTANPTAATIKSKIDTAIAALQQVGINSGTILFNSATYLMFEGAVSRVYANESGISTRVETYNGYTVKVVPDAVIGTVRYLVIGAGCAANITKHVYSQAFAPGQHTQGDGWLLQYRVIYDAIVMDNRAVGLFVNQPSS
jgi:hypothetical protein